MSHHSLSFPLFFRRRIFIISTFATTQSSFYFPISKLMVMLISLKINVRGGNLEIKN